MDTPRTAQQIDPSSTLGIGVQGSGPDTSYAGATIPTPATPATPAAPVSPTTPPNQAVPNPTPSPNTPSSPAVPPVSKHAQLFDSVLRTIGGGPQRRLITDPATGESRVAETPQTRGQLGKTIIAAVLSGMMTPSHTTEGPGGAQRIDASANMAEGAGAATALKTKRDDKAQAMADEAMSRKLNITKANIDAMHSYAAMTQSQLQAEETQSKIWQEAADRNNSTVLADADAYDKSITDNTAPKSRIAQHQTMEELLKHPEFKDKMTSSLMLQDGVTSMYDPATGKTRNVPTFSILNPNVSLKLSKESVDQAAKINPSFKGMYEATGGDFRYNLGRYVALSNQITSVNHAENLLQGLSDSKDPDLKALGITGDIEGKLSGVISRSPSALKALMEFENAQAQGGDTAAKLGRMLGMAGSSDIFNALGTSSDKVQAYINKINNDKLAAQKLAEQGGMGDKSPAAQPQVDGLVQAIQNDPNLSESDKKGLMVDVPAAGKDGVIHMNQGQVEKAVARMDSVIATNKGIAEKAALANGDPVAMKNFAVNTIEGDVNDITKAASMRGNARQNTINAIHDEAASRGLDTTKYTEAAIEAKAAMLKDFAGASTKTGAQLVAFNTFLGHAADAAEASDAWIRANSPLLNKPIAWLEKNAANDPNYIRFKTSLGAPAKEYMSFLNANRAEHEADIKQMDTVLDSNSTPLQVKTALAELAKTADVRLSSLGNQYLSTMGTTNPNLVTKTSLDTLRKFGITPTSEAVAQKIPKGWQGNAATPITPAIQLMIFNAAGKDAARAAAIAKDNGYTQKNGQPY